MTSPVFTSGCEMPGTPSISIGTRTPCQWMVVGAGELVLEVHDQPIADLGPDQRTRQAAVVGPRLHLETGFHFDLGEARFEVDLDDGRIGVAIDGLSQRHRGGDPGGPARVGTD